MIESGSVRGVNMMLYTVYSVYSIMLTVYTKCNYQVCKQQDSKLSRAGQILTEILVDRITIIVCLSC